MERDMSEGMADFIRRKRAAERGEDPSDEQVKRRSEIMKRVEERRKQKELEQTSGTASADSVTTESPSSAKVAELLRERRKAETLARKQTEKALNAANEKIKQLENELQSTLQTKQEEFDSLQRSAKSDKENFQNTINQLQKRIDTLEQQTSKVTQATENTSELDLLRTQLLESQQKIQNLEQKLSSVESELQQSQQTTTTLQQSINSLNENHTQSINSMQKRIDFLTEEKNALDQLVSQLQEELHSQETLSNQIQEDFDSLSVLVKEKDDEYHSLIHQIDLLQSERQQLSQLLVDQEAIDKEETELLETQLKEARELIAQLQTQPTTQQQSSSDITIKNLEKELNTVNERNKALQQQIEELKQSSSNNSSLGNPVVPHSSDEITSLQQDFKSELIKEINSLRSNPSQFADQLVEMLGSFKGLMFTDSSNSYQTKEGEKPVAELIEILRKTNPLPSVTLVEGLSKSCQYLCDQNGPCGIVNDRCADGTLASVRFLKYGKWKGKIMELMSYGTRSQTAKQVLLQWLIDDGNSSRSQRATLLDTIFSVAGVGWGIHKDFQFMAVLALAHDFIASDLLHTSARGFVESGFQESADGSCYYLNTKSLACQKSDLKLVLQEKDLILKISGKETIRWPLPISTSPSNISATFSNASTVEIRVNKTSPTPLDGELLIQKFSLEKKSECLNDRLKLQVNQQLETIIFTIEPCSCEVQVSVKILESSVLCFESVYTESSKQEEGTVITKTINRKEKVNMPFALEASKISLEPTATNGMSVHVLKPTASSEVYIPIQ